MYDEEEKDLEAQGFRISDGGDSDLDDDLDMGSDMPDLDFGLDEEDPDKDS